MTAEQVFKFWTETHSTAFVEWELVFTPDSPYGPIEVTDQKALALCRSPEAGAALSLLRTHSPFVHMETLAWTMTKQSY